MPRLEAHVASDRAAARDAAAFAARLAKVADAPAGVAAPYDVKRLGEQLQVHRGWLRGPGILPETLQGPIRIAFDWRRPASG